MTTINDANWAFLAEQTGMFAPFNDMYFHYLRSLGYVGTLQDMIAVSGFGMNPSGLKNPITNTGGGVPFGAMFRIRNNTKEYAVSPSRDGSFAVRSAS